MLRTLTSLLCWVLLSGFVLLKGLGGGAVCPPLGPGTPVLDMFNRTGPELGPNWATPVVLADNAIEITSNELINTTGASSAYAVNLSFTGTVEVYITASDHLGGTGPDLSLYIIYDGVGTTALDAYYVEVEELSGAANDRWRLFRVVDNSPTLLGSFVVQELLDGEKVLLRYDGALLIAQHYNGSTWSTIISQAESTLSGTAQLGVGLNNSNLRADDLGGGTCG